MAGLISEYEVFANSLDFDDCGKKFLCQMSGKKSGFNKEEFTQFNKKNFTLTSIGGGVLMFLLPLVFDKKNDRNL